MLGVDIFHSILEQISCPKTYIKLSLVCKRIYSVADNKDLTSKFLIKFEQDGYYPEKNTINLLKNNIKEGPCERYWIDKITLIEKCNYTMDKKNGLCETWHLNGQAFEKVNYISGIQDGCYLSWYDNGQLSSRINYSNKQINGLVESWHENGHLERKCNYILSKMNGICETWDENGQLISRKNYINGLLVPN